MDALVCPKGHESTEADYCSECGAKLVEAAPAAAASAAASGAQEQVCPKCGSAREDLAIPFCEACGYNFVTRSGGVEPAASAGPPRVAAGWTITVNVDASLRDAGSPEPPADFKPLEITLAEGANLIGRRSVARAIDPEIALTFDDAVSHRHALLQLGSDGALTLRDIGSSNGTRLNGRDLQAMVDAPLKDGDEITLGHWTRIVVRERV